MKRKTTAQLLCRITSSTCLEARLRCSQQTHWPDSSHWHGTRKDALADAVLKARLVLDVNMELDVRIEGFDLPALAAVTR